MDRIITAQMIIDAKDGTGDTFINIARKVQQLGKDAKVSGEIDRLAKSMQGYGSQLKAIEGYTRQRNAFFESRTKFQETAKAATAASAAIAGMSRPTAAAIADARRTQQALDKTKLAFEKQGKAVLTARRTLTEYGVPLDRLITTQRSLREKIDATSLAIGRQAEAELKAARVRAKIKQIVTPFKNTGVIAGPGLLHATSDMIRAGADVQSVRVDMQKAGIKPQEISGIEKRSLDLATMVRNVSQGQLMELAKEVRSVMTDPKEMMEVLEPLAKAKSVLDAKDSTGEASQGLAALVKGAENIGAAKDPARLTKLIDGYVKAIQVMGKTISPEQIYEFDKYSKLAGASLSDRFLMTTGLSVSQEMGGSTAGKATGQLYKQISGGMQNLHTAAKEFARMGLIDPANLDYLPKTGEVKGIKAGVRHAVRGDELAATDPDLFTYQVLLPALEKKGIKTQADQLAEVQKMFPNSGVADLIGKFIVQRSTYESHAKQYGAATGNEGYKLNAEDPIAALGELTKSLETFAGVLTSPVMKDAAIAMDWTATQIGKVSTAYSDFAKEHPDLAKIIGGGAIVGGGYEGAKLTYGLFEKVFGDGGLKGAAAAQLEAGSILQKAGIDLEAAAIKLGGGSMPGGGGLPGEPSGKGPTSFSNVNRAALLAFGLPGIVANAPSFGEDGDKERDANQAAITHLGQMLGADYLKKAHDSIFNWWRGGGIRSAQGAIASGSYAQPSRPGDMGLHSDESRGSPSAPFSAPRRPFTPPPAGLTPFSSAPADSIDRLLERQELVDKFNNGLSGAGFNLGQLDKSTTTLATSFDTLSARIAALGGGEVGEGGGGIIKANYEGGDFRGSYGDGSTSRRVSSGSGGGDGSTSGGSGRRGGPPLPSANVDSVINRAGLTGFNTRGVRNMNIGNIGWGGWARAHGAIGGAGSDTGHLVAVFPNFEAGAAAASSLALSKYSAGARSIDALVAGRHGWTPGNHMAAANIARMMGISPFADARLSDPAMMAKFKSGLSVQELGPAGARYARDHMGGGQLGHVAVHVKIDQDGRVRHTRVQHSGAVKPSVGAGSTGPTYPERLNI